MKKKILLFVSIFVVFVVKLALDFNVMASDATMPATIRGYDIPEEFECIEEMTFENKTISTSSYYYGTMSGWTGAYKYLDESSNTMYVVIMCTGGMQPNRNSSWDQLRWNNERMEILFSNPTYNATLIDFTPRVDGQTISHNFSASISGGIDGDGNPNLSFSSGHDESYNENEIILTSIRQANYYENAEISHYFSKCKTNTSLNSVCCNYYQENHMAVYEIRDYDPNDHYLIGVTLTCSFYRNGRFNDSSVEDFYIKTYQIEGTTEEN